MRKSKSRSRRFWTNVVAEFEQNPTVSKKEFSQKRGLHPGTFESWLYKLRRERREVQEEPQELRLVEVALPTAGGTQSAGNSSAIVAGEGYSQFVGQVEMALPSGISLRFDTNVPPPYLGELVVALEGGTRC